MRVVILAAGEGNRLRPHTLDKPKCMVPLGGKALLERQMGCLQSCGLSNISIVTGYRSEVIDPLGLPSFHNEDFNCTNMVFSLMKAKALFDGSEDILITYGDIVFEPFVIQSLLKDETEISLAINVEWKKLWQLRMENPLSDAESLIIDARGMVTEIGKPVQSYGKVQGQYMGLVKVKKEMAPKLIQIYNEMSPDLVLDGKDKKNMYMTSFLQFIIHSGIPIKAVPVNGGWLEVDTVDDLNCYEELLQAGKLTEYCNLSN